MKNTYYRFIIGLVFIGALAGCGGGMGAPGSSNSDSTGIIIQSAGMTVSSPDINAFNVCADGKTVGPGLKRTDGTLKISAAALVAGATDDPFPATLQQCTITYLKANEDPASPIIETFTIYPDCPIVNGAATCPVTVMDISRKDKWALDVTGGSFASSEHPSHYVAVADCQYMNVFGKVGTFTTQLDIWLAWFPVC